MARALTWSWLLSRLPSGPGRRASCRPGRPCLPAVEQLEDRVLLSGAVLPAAGTAPPPLSQGQLSTINIFLKIEKSLVENQESFIKGELNFIKGFGGNVPAPVVDYFLKLDNDFLKLDSDLIGPAGVPASGVTAALVTTPGGLDGALLTLKLPPDLTADIQIKLIPEVQEAMTATNAAITQLQGTGGVTAPAAAVDYFLKLDEIEYKEYKEAAALSISFETMDAKFGEIDPVLTGPAKTFRTDLGTLADDAATTNAVVLGLLKLEGSFLKGENSFLKIEDAFVKAGAPLSADDVAYFLKLDSDFLQLDNDFLSIDNALLGSNPTVTADVSSGVSALSLPGDIIDQVQKLISEVRAAIDKATGAAHTMQTYPVHIGMDYIKLDGIKHKEEAVTESLSLSFEEIKVKYTPVDPKDAAALDNDLRRLATDAKGQGTSGGGTTK